MIIFIVSCAGCDYSIAKTSQENARSLATSHAVFHMQDTGQTVSEFPLITIVRMHQYDEKIPERRKVERT